MASLRKPQRSTHIHNCRHKELACTLERLQPELRYCFAWFSWFVEEEWDKHCQAHLKSITSKRCGSSRLGTPLYEDRISSSCTGKGKVGTGDSAVATARKLGIPSFEYTTPKNYHPVKLAITELSDIQSAFATVFDKFGRVDLVNNAEYSRHFEELSDSQIGTQKEVNFFSLINDTRMAVEAMKD